MNLSYKLVPDSEGLWMLGVAVYLVGKRIGAWSPKFKNGFKDKLPLSEFHRRG